MNSKVLKNITETVLNSAGHIPNTTTYFAWEKKQQKPIFHRALGIKLSNVRRANAKTGH